jgi:hypothetical protein
MWTSDVSRAGEVIFRRVREYIKRFIILKDENAYDFLALWAMGTYLFRVFMYYPYILLQGEKQCGKSLLMEVLAAICFNGESSVNTTEAVLFRDVHNNSLTMFVDEAENLRRQDKDQNGGIMSVLKSGFYCGGQVKRCGGRNMDKIMRFNCYSPKALAGIQGVDDVLQDRMIKIRMVRRLKQEPVDRYIRSPMIEEMQISIRESLYLFGLNWAREIARQYTDQIEKIEGLSHLRDREMDIWSPIIVLANVIDAQRADEPRTLTEAIVAYSKKKVSERTLDNERENDTVLMVTVLNRMLEERTPTTTHGDILEYRTDDAFDFFHLSDEFSWLESKSKLTRLLAKVEVSTQRVRIDGKQVGVYVIQRELLKDYTARFIASEESSRTGIESGTEENDEF